MPRLGPITVILTTLLLAGCGDDYSITEQNLTGEVGGASWNFAEGDTNAFLSDDDYFTNLYGEVFDECAASPSGNHLIVNIPKETGEWGLSLSRNMTFVVHTTDGIENLIGTEGVLRVDEITADAITGGIYAKFDGSNEIDGVFTATICQ